MALTTELDAVNQMLALIGEAPVAALPADDVPEATKAYTTLTRVSREVQTMDWDFNREEGVEFQPDENGEIFVDQPDLFITQENGIIRAYDEPIEGLASIPTVLKVDASDPWKLIVYRAGKLYDKKNHTSVFEDNLKCDVVWLLPFTDLPEPARQYIAIRAARQFIKTELGSDTLSGLSAEEEQKALLSLVQYDSDSGDFNLFRDDPESAYITFR